MKIWVNTGTMGKGKIRDKSNEINIALSNIAEACTALGHEVVHGQECNMYDCIFLFASTSRRKDSQNKRNRIIRDCWESKKPVFHLDTGIFSTYIRRHISSNQSNYFRIGLGDCVGTGDFLNENSNPKRFEMLKKKYNFSENPTKSSNSGHILFLLQNPRGWQYDELEDYNTWARNTLLDIRKYTNREILVRPHPNHQDHSDFVQITKKIPNVSKQKTDKNRQKSADDIKHAAAVVTHSSSAVTEAYVEGVPVFVTSNRCFGYEYYSMDLSKLSDLETYNWNNRYQVLCNWAMSSWHLEEMRDSKIIKRYLDRI